MKTYTIWTEVNGTNVKAGERRAKSAENALRAQARIDGRKVEDIDSSTGPNTTYALCGSVIYKTETVAD